MNDLKPCPLCNRGKVYLRVYPKNKWCHINVTCDCCGLQLGQIVPFNDRLIERAKKELTTRWNRRGNE